MPYVAARFTDDPHLWLTTLIGELVPLGWEAGYQCLTGASGAIACGPAARRAPVPGRDTIDPTIPRARKIQWDSFERRRAPWGGTAYILLGSLSPLGPDTGRDRDLHGPGPTHRGDGRRPASPRWHGPRLAHRSAGHGDRARQPRCPAVLRPVARHYGVMVRPCPPGAGTARGWSRRRSATCAVAGRGSSSRPPWRRPRRSSTASAPRSPTIAPGPAPPSGVSPTPSRCCPCRPCPIPPPSGHRGGTVERHGRLPGRPLLRPTGSYRARRQRPPPPRVPRHRARPRRRGAWSGSTAYGPPAGSSSAARPPGGPRVGRAPSFTTAPPANPRATNRRGRSPGARLRPPRTQTREVIVDLARYAELADAAR